MINLLEIAICSDKMQLANVCAEHPSLPVHVSNSSLLSLSRCISGIQDHR